MTTSRAARIAAGISIDRAASVCRITQRHLQTLECRNSFPYHLADRLSRLYRCRIEDFIRQPGGRPPRKPRRAGTSGGAQAETY